jgi:hypothetical protein
MSDVIAIIDILANNKLVVGREAEIFAILFDNLTEISSESAKLDTIDWDNEKDALVDLVTALQAFVNVEGVDLDNLGADTFKNQEAVDALVDVLIKLSVSGVGAEIIPQFFDYALSSFEIPYISDLSIDYDNVDWAVEMQQLKAIIDAAKAFGGITSEEFADNIANSTDRAALAVLLHAVNESEMLRPMLPKMIHEALVIADLTDWEDAWFKDQIDEEMALIGEWTAEIEILADLIVEVANFNVNEFNIENATDEDVESVGRILHLLNRSNIFNMNNITSVLEVTDPNSILYGADFSNLPTTEAEWEVEIDILVQALKEFNAARPIAIEKHAEIGKVLNTMKQSTIIGPNLELIIENSTAQIDDNFSSYIDIKKVDLYAIDWEVELETVYNIYTAFGNEAGESSFTDLADRIAESGDEEAIADLLRNVNNSELARQMLPKMIHEALVAADLTDWEDDWFKSQTGEGGVMASKEEWATEIVNLSSLLAKTANFDLNSFNMESSSEEDIDTVGSILSDMNYSRIFDINNLPSILEVTDPNSVLYGSDFTNLPADNAEWDDEITTLVKALKELKSIKPVAIDKHNEIGTLLNTIQDSVILGHNINLIVNNSLEQFNPKFMSYVVLSEIETLSVDWVVELGVLNTLFNDFGDFTVDGFKISSLNGDKIESIMITASTGEVATQIFGKLYNEQLEAVLGRHNPQDDDGLIYDYTNQAVLRDNASNVGKLIDFGNETQALYQNPGDKDQGIVVGNLIKSYKASAEEERPTFADVYFPAIMAYANGIDNDSPLDGLDMTTVDYELEGDLFIEFFEAETEVDKLTVLGEIYATSTLTKAIMISMGHTL